MDTNAISGPVAQSVTDSVVYIVGQGILKWGPGVGVAFIVTAWAKHSFPLTKRGKALVLPIVSVLAGIFYEWTVTVGGIVLSSPSARPDLSIWFMLFETTRGIGLGIGASLGYILGGHKVEKWLVSKVKKSAN